MRVLVCGGRDFTNAPYISEVLSKLHAERHFTVLIHGNARGTDSIAGHWARQHWPFVKEIAVPAEWAKNGLKAGPMRNQDMLGHKPDLVVAFPGKSGTADMVRRARKAGVEVIEVPFRDVP